MQRLTLGMNQKLQLRNIIGCNYTADNLFEEWVNNYIVNFTIKPADVWNMWAILDKATTSK